MIPLVLYVLATLDSAFCGYRAAAGRSALVDKSAYYRRALLRGALAGQAAVAIAAIAIGIALALVSDSPTLLAQLLSVGGRMLAVYVPYAAVLVLAFAFRAIPSVDVRSLTSTLVFGPLTLTRPIVVIAGLAWGLAAAPRPAVAALVAIVGLMMLLLERALGPRDAAPGAPTEAAARS
jgi:hypothetical protein